MRYQVEGPCGVLVSGDLATWVGSIGTLLAFVIALILLAIGVTDRRRAQARLVTAYVSEGRIQYPAGTRITQMRGYGTPMAFKVGLTGDPSAYVLAQDAVSFRWEFRNDSDEMLGRTRIVLIDERGRDARPQHAPICPAACRGRSARGQHPCGCSKGGPESRSPVRGRGWSIVVADARGEAPFPRQARKHPST